LIVRSCLDKVIAWVWEVRGIDLAGYRRPMLERRLAARMRKLGISDQAGYVRRLASDRAECDRLIDAVGINVSSFFRDPLVFEIVRKRILPEILERKREKSSREIRVWSAGCGAGEEAYSIAILIHGAIKGEVANWIPRIFATDIDGEALAPASARAHPRERFDPTKLGILDEYLVSNETGFEVRPFIRKMVRFSRHDLTSRKTVTPPDSVFGSFDVVLCRNVLIYFSPSVQARAFENLCRAVARGGYLILGESESLDKEAELKLDTVDRSSRIFRKRLR